MHGHDHDFDKIIKRLTIDDSPQGDHKDKLRWEMLRTFNASKEGTRSDGSARIGRTIMQSRIMKYAVAAVIAIAAIWAFNAFDSTGSVTWAEVVSHLEKIETFSFQHHLTITDADKEVKIESTVYASTEHGWRLEQDVAGKLQVSKYISPAEKAVIEVIPKMKKYTRGHLSDAQIEEFQRLSDPREMVKKFMSLKYRELGPETINGMAVEGIEINDPKLGAGTFEECQGRLWVSVATNLPVRVEFDGYASNRETRTQVVADAFTWKAGLAAHQFEAKIPEDYSLLADVSISDNDEEVLVKGLRDFSEVTGAYPSQLAIMTASKEVRAGLIAQREAQGVPRDAPPTRAEIEKGVTIQASCLFYARLVKEELDAAYYGDKVTPQDSKKVLMRWKISDEQYRVILGDLSMRDVNHEELVQLEGQPLEQ